MLNDTLCQLVCDDWQRTLFKSWNSRLQAIAVFLLLLHQTKKYWQFSNNERGMLYRGRHRHVCHFWSDWERERKCINKLGDRKCIAFQLWGMKREALCFRQIQCILLEHACHSPFRMWVVVKKQSLQQSVVHSFFEGQNILEVA